ncbi:MAG: acyloxyacyl hydrolase [Deltaproteobacteria bacterium]|nr:acyloxyacyl hydrolase [Deltaproteobacteria bacterium]
MRITRTLLVALLAWLVSTTSASADGSCLELREWGVRAGGGINSSSLIQYYAIHPYWGLSLWDPASRWFEKYGIRALWMIEPWAAYVNDDNGRHKTDSFEIGMNALFVRLVFGEATLRPFIEAGEGAVYTDLRKQDLGTRLQFTSTIGGGLEYEVRPGVAVGLQARFRHMSNAGMASSNPGINTVYGLIGLTFR